MCVSVCCDMVLWLVWLSVGVVFGSTSFDLRPVITSDILQLKWNTWKIVRHDSQFEATRIFEPKVNAALQLVLEVRANFDPTENARVDAEELRRLRVGHRVVSPSLSFCVAQRGGSESLCGHINFCAAVSTLRHHSTLEAYSTTMIEMRFVCGYQFKAVSCRTPHTTNNTRCTATKPQPGRTRPLHVTALCIDTVSDPIRVHLCCCHMQAQASTSNHKCQIILTPVNREHGPARPH